MTWSRVVLVAAAAASLLAGETHAQACPEGQFSVSVLDDPQIKCLASRPCSGVYGPEGLVGGVGACPSGTGCALLPHNPSVMGCVIAGRADVSYVNPDGSLTKGGVVIAGPPNANNANNNNPQNVNNANNNANNGANPNNGASPNNGANANNNGANANGAAANGNSTVATTATPAANTNVPTPAHVKPGDITGSNDGTAAPKAPSPTPSSPAASSSAAPAPASSGKPGEGSAAPSATTVAPTPTPTTAVPTTTPSPSPTASSNQQKALDNIDGGIVSNRNSSPSGGGLGLGSVIAIVVGCLAVVAVIAGVFVLRKKKERALETPAGGALDDYMGAGGVTPKENVLLL